MRKMIEKVSYGNKLELFARQRYDGWDAWGNQVEGSIELGVQTK
jgi:N6-adenosine-specific RNA methylase IME4